MEVCYGWENRLDQLQLSWVLFQNSSFNEDDETTTLEYGQYALAFSNSKTILDELTAVFNPVDACRIYLTALIHFVNSFVRLKDVKEYYDQSWLSIKYPDAKTGYKSLSILLDSLGRKQTRVEQFERNLMENSSKNLAIDGHVVKSTPDCNDLADFGNKYRVLKNRQLNILMAYDIKTGRPLLSRIYDGGELDKSSIRDILAGLISMTRFSLSTADFILQKTLMIFHQTGTITLSLLHKT